MICHKPTTKHPNGRTGTPAGYQAHKRLGEKACPECLANANQPNQRDYIREWYLKNTYNITLEEYEAMVENQKGLCAICSTSPKKQQLSVDHDHRCCPGKKSCGACVRALLCGDCNRAIGLLQDEPQLLRKAATYIDNYTVTGVDLEDLD